MSGTVIASLLSGERLLGGYVMSRAVENRRDAGGSVDRRGFLASPHGGTLTWDPAAGCFAILRGDTALARIRDLRIAPLPVTAAQSAPLALVWVDKSPRESGKRLHPAFVPTDRKMQDRNTGGRDLPRGNQE